MLPSQSPREKSRRLRARRRPRPVRRLVWLLLAVIAVTVVIWATRDGEEASVRVDDQVAANDLPATPASTASTGSTDGALPEGEAGDEPMAARSTEPPRPVVPDDDDEPPAATLAMGEALPETLGRPEGLDPDPAPVQPEVTERRETAPASAAPASDASDRPTPRPVLAEGRRLLAEGRLVAARDVLSRALRQGTLDEAEAAEVRSALSEINGALVFGPVIARDDPFAMEYVIKSGDTLAKIVATQGLQVDWRFVQRINGIREAHRIREGQRLKLITGPFHAVIDKLDYRLDLYMGDYVGEDMHLVYVRSFPVGLGEFDSTPVGMFRVRADSKLIDPEWVNPRTGERFTSDDPANPIGDRWIGLEGMDESNRSLAGYGIHGTIDPQSIGGQHSMGCVRMLEQDVAIVYEALVEGVSRVQIVEDY